VAEYSKRERAELRRLAAEVYEWELRGQLELLDKSFAEWRRGKMLSSELADAIHQFHQHEARDIWSMYQTLKDPEIVARGIALGAIVDDALSAELRDKIKPLSHHFREAVARIRAF
jgi:hypothetical protein